MLEVEGRIIETTDDGFLVDAEDWNDKVAEVMAEREGMELSDAHREIMGFIRSYYFEYAHLPNARMFSKAIRQVLGEEKGGSRYLHRLFPRGPLKYACKLAGLPKPPTCL